MTRSVSTVSDLDTLPRDPQYARGGAPSGTRQGQASGKRVTAADLARMEARFKSIQIAHPRLVEGHERLEEARLAGLETPGMPQRFLPICAPSGSGKTTIVETYAAAHAAADVDRPYPRVLHVGLSEKATVIKLGFDILHALGDAGLPEEVLNDIVRRVRRVTRFGDSLARLNQAQIMYVAGRALVNAGVELLCVDEIHHLIHGDGTGELTLSVTEALKKLVDSGICPIVLIGTHKARTLVSAKVNRQVSMRCADPVDLDPLKIEDARDHETFAGYVCALSVQVEAAGVLPARQALERGDNIACFYDVSRGVIGIVSRLVLAAAKHAARRGSDTIEDEDLSRATRTWAFRLGITDDDPWTDGPRDLATLPPLDLEQ